MIAWLSATFGIGALSAVLPVINMEAYLLGARAAHPVLPWFALGVFAALGQMAGKLVFFYAGRGGIRLGHRLQRKTDPTRSRRWVTWISSFRQACTERPVVAGTILFASSVTGLPPLAVVCVVAGAAGMHPVPFFVLGLVGRTIRFSVLALMPSLINYL